MKKILLAVLSISLFIGLQAQSVHGLHYKFLLTDNGAPVTSPVNIKFRISDGSGTLWEEEHTGVTPDAHGIAAIVVGTGTQTGGSLSAFSDLDWSQDLTYDVDVDTGSGYTSFVSGQAFYYSPKAKFAESADYTRLLNKPVHFYMPGGTDEPTAITDSVYHTGRVSIGTDVDAGNASLLVFNQSAGTVQAFKAEMNVTDNENKNAAYHLISGSGNGYLKAAYNHITADGSGTHIASYNQVSDAGSGTHVGTYNRMTGSGTGFQVGMENDMFATGDNYQYGIYNSFSNNGNGDHYGMVTYLMGNGNGLQAGIFTIILNQGTGDKYGEYVYIDPSVPGTHYGIRSEVEKPSGFAGYFVGNVYVSAKLTAPQSGPSDMKAYLYGAVDAAGNIDANASSLGFSVSGSAGHYTVTFDTALPDTGYTVQATVEGNDYGLVRIVKSNTGFEVYTADLSGNQTGRDFSFVVYKR